MRKLDLTDYTAKAKVPDPAKPGGLLDIQYPYPVKESLLQVMFAPQLKLTGPELLKQTMLGMKIESCKDGSILLEDAEWERLKQAVTVVTGFSSPDVEFVRRILEAPETPINT